MKAQRGSKGTAPLILNLDTRWWWVVNFKAQPPYARERNPVPTEQESEGTPVPVWTFSRKKISFPHLDSNLWLYYYATPTPTYNKYWL